MEQRTKDDPSSEQKQDVESVQPTAGATTIMASRPDLPKWRLICLTISLSFGLFLSLLDTTIVATALYTIGVDLKSLASVNWVALAYTLSYLSCAVIFARIADIVGRRNAYLAAFVIFFAFSLGCGFAQTLNQLIALRVLQGIGGAGLYSLTFVILPELVPLKMLRSIGALIGAIVATAGVLGPLLGGLITRYTTWRWIFWINAPVGSIPFILFILAWPKKTQYHHIANRSWKQLDLIGAILVIAASVLVVFPFQEAGFRGNIWKSALFIAPLIIGCGCWFLLLVWEMLVAKHWEDKLATMFPFGLIKLRVFMGHALTTLLGGFSYFVVIYSLPLRMQVVNGKSQLIAGIALLPMLGAVAVASFVSGMINTRRDSVFELLLLGSALMVIGTATLSTLKNDVNVEAKMYGFEVFVGLGFGFMVSTASYAAALESELKDRTVAQGIIAQARVLGGSIGIAMSTAILGVTQRHELAGIVTALEIATLETSVKFMTPEQLTAVRQAYSDSFSESMKVCAIVSGVCCVGSCLTWKKKRVDMVAKGNEMHAARIEAVVAGTKEVV